MKQSENKKLDDLLRLKFEISCIGSEAFGYIKEYVRKPDSLSTSRRLASDDDISGYLMDELKISAIYTAPNEYGWYAENMTQQCVGGESRTQAIIECAIKILKRGD